MAGVSRFGATMERTTLHRSFQVHQRDIDTATRTVTLSFASETPCPRWFGNEILDCASTSIRLGRLQSAAPLLCNHDMECQIGVVESVSLGADRVCRATVRFGSGEEASEIFQDVVDGIRKNVSVGYLVHGMQLEKSDSTGDTYRVNDWEPIEISIVAVPADPSVGVGREIEPLVFAARAAFFQPQHRGELKMEPDEIVPTTPPAAAPATPPTAPSVETRALPADPRETQIRHFATVAGTTEADVLARRAIVNNTSVEEFRRQLVEQMQASATRTPVSTAMPASGDRLPAQVIGYRPRNFQGEGAAERAYRAGLFFAQNLFGAQFGDEARRRINDMASRFGYAERAIHSGTDNASGGYLVPTELATDILYLTEMFGVIRANALVTPMGSDTKEFLVRQRGLAAYFVKESTASDKSKIKPSRHSLVAKKAMVLTDYPSELDEDSIVSLGDEITGEIAEAFAQLEDECGFLGDASSTYNGITGIIPKLQGLDGTVANIAGIIVGSGNAWSELVLADFHKVKGRLPHYVTQRANGRIKWFCHKEFYENVMVKLALAAGGTDVTQVLGLNSTPMFLGYPVEFAQVMAKAEANSQIPVLFGAMDLAVRFGDRRTVQVKLSEHSQFDTDDLVIKGTERFDINVHSVGNADATAANRVPGPLVGLQTSAS